jgi:hypothetical protein
MSRGWWQSSPQNRPDNYYIIAYYIFNFLQEKAVEALKLKIEYNKGSITAFSCCRRKFLTKKEAVEATKQIKEDAI